jgi:hypothetical protein
MWVRDTTEYEFWSLVALLVISLVTNLVTWSSGRKRITALEKSVEGFNANFSTLNNLIALYIKTEKKLRKDGQDLKELEMILSFVKNQTPGS